MNGGRVKLAADLAAFAARLGHDFRQPALLVQAVTHASLSSATRPSNERLEFLGDAVIQVVVTEHLFRMFPDFSEGRMTKLRTRIVSRMALRERALALDLGAFLMMGRGEEASGGRERASTLADAFEAVVGAIYLDGGFEASRMFLLQQMDEIFADLESQPEEINPKGFLQELLQSIAPNAPEYELLSQSGPEHSKKFVCRVVWNGIELGRGEGLSKKEAQVAAAEAALEKRPWEKEARKKTAAT